MNTDCMHRIEKYVYRSIIISNLFLLSVIGRYILLYNHVVGTSLQEQPDNAYVMHFVCVNLIEKNNL